MEAKQQDVQFTDGGENIWLSALLSWVVPIALPPSAP
jgi:hypothetical protein